MICDFVPAAPRASSPASVAEIFACSGSTSEPIPSAGFRLREITLTSLNTGTLTSEQIKTFNRVCQRRPWRRLLKVKGWGAIWCDEVGFDNTNLHAHILFYGPFVPQRRLVEVWKQVSGFEVVYIEKAHARGLPGALDTCLKYVSKPPSKRSQQIGLLEVAFHGTRRVHAVGFFYNFVGERPGQR